MDTESVDAYSSCMSPILSDHGTILEEKRSRKQVNLQHAFERLSDSVKLEEDAMRLRNRVRTLQKEEQRVNKQISLTQIKISKATQIKQQKQQRDNEKEIRKQIEHNHVLQRRWRILFIVKCWDFSKGEESAFANGE